MNASASLGPHFLVDNETYTILQGLDSTDAVVGSLPLIPSHHYHPIDTISPFSATLSWVSNSSPYLMLLLKHREDHFTGPLLVQLAHKLWLCTCIIGQTPEGYCLSNDLQESWRSLELNLNALCSLCLVCFPTMFNYPKNSDSGHCLAASDT